MTSPNEAEHRALDFVVDTLRAAYGEDDVKGTERGVFFVRGGPNAIRVRVTPISGDAAIVDVYTWVGHDVEVTDDLCRYLLDRNTQIRFGKASIDRDGDILLEHSLFPEQLSATVLLRLVELVAELADQVEGELRKRFE